MTPTIPAPAQGTPYPLDIRPLPIRIRLFPDETTKSFLHRLEDANAIPPGQLRKTLYKIPGPWIETTSLWCGQSIASVAYAMPQLGLQQHGLINPKHVAGRRAHRARGLACHRCALAHEAGRIVEIYTTHDQAICPIHGLWTGEGTAHPDDQLSIGACPALPAAWHHHKNIIQRQGRTRTRKAFETSRTINWQWYDQFHHFGYAANIYDVLAMSRPRRANQQAMVAASLYPAIVELAAALASPYWAKIAHSNHPEKFLDRISTTIAEGWRPAGAHDPLRSWMERNWDS